MKHDKSLKVCGKCFYWERWKRSACGECRKNPPIHQPYDIYNEDKIKGIWPLTNEKDWCGEFIKDF